MTSGFSADRGGVIHVVFFMGHRSCERGLQLLSTKQHALQNPPLNTLTRVFCILHKAHQTSSIQIQGPFLLGNWNVFFWPKMNFFFSWQSTGLLSEPLFMLKHKNSLCLTRASVRCSISTSLTAVRHSKTRI